MFRKKQDDLRVGLTSETHEGIRKQSRSCTDCVWVLLFLAYWLVMLGIGYYAIKYEDYKRVVNGYDYQGNTCGEGLCAGYPFRYFPYASEEIGTPYFAFCVNECRNDQVPGQARTISSCSPEQTALLQMIVNTPPGGDVPLAMSRTQPTFKSFCVSSEVVEAGGKITQAQAPGQTQFTRLWLSLQDSWRVFLVAVCVAPVLGFVFLLLLRFCGGPIILLMIVAAIAVLFLMGCELTTHAGQYTQMYYKADKNIETGFKVLGFSCYALSAVVLLSSCCLRRSIMCSVQVIRHATHAIVAMWQLILLPYLKWALLLVLLGWWVVVTVSMISVTGFKDVDVRDCGDIAVCENLNRTLGAVLAQAPGPSPAGNASGVEVGALTYKEMSFNKDLRYGLLFQAWGLLWSADVVVFLQQMVIAVAVSTWYFQPNKGPSGRGAEFAGAWPLCRGLRLSFCTHLGTVVFAAALVSLVQFARAVISYVQKVTGHKKDGPKGRVVRCVLCMCACCLCCLDKCLHFISSQALIMTAVRGHSFCRSCSEIFSLVSRNAARVGVLHTIGHYSVFIGKLFVAAATTMLAYYLMDSDLQEFKNPQPLLPTVLVFVASWIIGSLFMQVYSQTINVLMLCYIMDEEMHMGRARHATPGLHKYWDTYGGDPVRESDMAIPTGSV